MEGYLFDEYVFEILHDQYRLRELSLSLDLSKKNRMTKLKGIVANIASAKTGHRSKFALAVLPTLSLPC